MCQFLPQTARHASYLLTDGALLQLRSVNTKYEKYRIWVLEECTEYGIQSSMPLHALSVQWFLVSHVKTTTSAEPVS